MVEQKETGVTTADTDSDMETTVAPPGHATDVSLLRARVAELEKALGVKQGQVFNLGSKATRASSHYPRYDGLARPTEATSWCASQPASAEPVECDHVAGRVAPLSPNPRRAAIGRSRVETGESITDAITRPLGSMRWSHVCRFDDLANVDGVTTVI